MASRRPKRKCRLQTSEKYSPLTKALGSGRDQEGFEVRYINGYIGHGVFASQKFNTGDFLLEYKGDLVSRKEGERREAQYTPTKGSFLMFFSYDGKRLCMDGTEDPFDTNMARMINDEGENPNCVMRAISFLGRPRLCLFALKDINIGEELRYDYGVEDLPWRLESKRKSLRRNSSLDELTFCGLNKETTKSWWM
ncbi:N-lysine methyltransferase KMT5A-A-like [Liolophura sinensis]|uniref:N-lysine methyltransferase KMT5A-A-like n=1 Tax=Liolophura sinensis TaxID=3198878 RepID=UPI00315933BA